MNLTRSFGILLQYRIQAQWGARSCYSKLSQKYFTNYDVRNRSFIDGEN
jgi:hypothetical protein